MQSEAFKSRDYALEQLAGAKEEYIELMKQVRMNARISNAAVMLLAGGRVAETTRV